MTSIAINETHNTNQLTFRSTVFNPVSHANKIWFTAVELARALEYKKSDAVTQIYERNSDEFNSTMTETLKMSASDKSKGCEDNLQKTVRVFSLRGAHLVAMFSKTGVAKEFRKWILDILDREVEKESQAIKPKTRRSTASQLTPLRQTAERLITTGLGRIYPDIWKLVHEHFEIKHITQLEPTQIAEAIEFLNVLEGEYLGKEELPKPNIDLSSELRNVNALHKNLMHLKDVWDRLNPHLFVLAPDIAHAFNGAFSNVSGPVLSLRNGIERKACLLN
ncbi:BRO-N domain-containing protein [Xenorhabdus bovienii]|uniref:BRO-N domain-containing protein n=1 Tax=Xenorhabdus bovienii TaxID=40576 RepID=UPI0023B2D92D|nr:BRO family protein [Xenorhabdus bovienii]